MMDGTQSFSNQKVFQLIAELNSFINEADALIGRMQQRYITSAADLREKHRQARERFEAECEAAVTNVRGKGQRLLSDAVQIEESIDRLEKQLASVDKYYLKTKAHRQEELAGLYTDAYKSMEDPFEALEQIKAEYTSLNRKYSENVLPKIVDDLHFLFSNRRKADYADLIILRNTVEKFISEIKGSLPELTASLISDMRHDFEQQHKELEISQANDSKNLESQYGKALQSAASTIDSRLEQIFPSDLLDLLASMEVSYYNSYKRVSSSYEAIPQVFYLGHIAYKTSDYTESKTLASLINEKCRQFLVDETLCFPIMLTPTASTAFYIRSSRDAVAFVNSIMFSFLSQVPVGKISYSVCDIEGQGNNIRPFFDIKKELPDLFNKGVYTTSDSIKQRLCDINEYVEHLSQSKLGNKYSSVFDYCEKNVSGDYHLELLAVFGFPKGLDAQDISILTNIIVNGPRCGVCTIICQSDISDRDSYPPVSGGELEKLKACCEMVRQQGHTFVLRGLPFLPTQLPQPSEIDRFFSNYLLALEATKERGIVFPPIIRRLAEGRDPAQTEDAIQEINTLREQFARGFCKVPPRTTETPDTIMLGNIQYHASVFADFPAYQRIVSEYGKNGADITLPMLLDLAAPANLIIPYSGQEERQAKRFTHHLMWCLLSFARVTGVNFCVIDPEQKGGSILPFLDFRKQCPEVFDDKIHTSSEEIYEKLCQVSRTIDDIIQNKLGARFENAVEYNKKSKSQPLPLTMLVIYDFPAEFDERSLELSLSILKNGPRCGIFTLLARNKSIGYDRYDTIDAWLDKFAPFCSEIDCTANGYSMMPFGLPVLLLNAPTQAEAEQFAKDYTAESKAIKSSGLGFDAILGTDLFKHSFTDSLAVPIGIGAGESIVSVKFGEGSSHHALIAGATGSGKTSLLHTMILSAMLHYAPDSVNLYLMDFKSGTEFKVYDTKRLPHIKLLALDAMQEFGESILEDLIAEMTRRSEKFKQCGAAKLGEYIEKTGRPLPHILVVMDEFQVLFNDATNRKIAYNCAEMTKRLVTEGRSFGIHLILSTQSTRIISDLSLSPGTLEQMRIRIGLKCGEYDSHYLFTERNDMQALEMMKGPIGTAVINNEYTEEDNIRFRTAFCSAEAREGYLDTIEKSLLEYPYSMMSFEGDRTTELLSVESARHGYSSDGTVSVEVGSLIKVAPPLEIRFDRRKKHHTLICGNGISMAMNIANIFSLAILKNRMATLYYFDGEELLGEGKNAPIINAFSRLSDRFIVAHTRGDIIKSVNDVYSCYLQRKKKPDESQIFIQINNLQFIDILKTMLRGEYVDEGEYLDAVQEDDAAAAPSGEDPFDFGLSGMTSQTSISEKLLKLIDDGAAYGIHFIIMCSDFQSVRECMYYGENVLAKFPERCVFSLSDSDADLLISDISLSGLRDNTVYYTDSIQKTFQVKPYIFPQQKELEEHIDSIIQRG